MRESIRKYENVKSKLIIIIFLLAINLYPGLFILSQNCYEVGFKDIVMPTLFFLIDTLLIYFIYRIIFHKEYIAGLYTGVMQFVFLNYQLIIEKLGYYSILSWIVIYGICSLGVIIGYVIKKSDNGVQIGTRVSRKIVIVGTFMFVFLIGINLISVLPKLYCKHTIHKENSEEIIAKQQDNNKRPNIYFIFVDEYSSEDTFKKYCDFNNEQFLSNLKKLGFNVSNSSYSGSTDTQYIWSSLLTLDGNIDYSITEEEHQRRMVDTSLFDVVKEKGYKVNIIASTNMITKKKADFSFGDKLCNYNSVESAESFIMNRTIFAHIYTHFLTIQKYENRANTFKEQLNYLTKCPNISNQPIFTVCYTDIVHGPWGIDENGKPVNDSGWHWENPSYYINHVKFFNRQIMPAIAELIEEDPNSIIIIESDHSFRQPYHLAIEQGIPMKDETEANKQMSQILNAVYYQGKEYNENNGASYVNTVIKVLNSAADTDIPETTFKFVNRPL